MLNLKNFQGVIEVNGNQVSSDFDFNSLNGPVSIRLVSDVLKPKIAPSSNSNLNIDSHEMFKFTVKSYMTQPASPEFDFMAKWNNNKPMPLRTMTGWIEKETKGMVYVHLKGAAEPTITCMRCGRDLTNPISRRYGIGPECMCKIGLIGLALDDVDTIRQKLVDVTWDGWVIRSSIIAKEAVRCGGD